MHTDEINPLGGHLIKERERESSSLEECVRSLSRKFSEVTIDGAGRRSGSRRRLTFYNTAGRKESADGERW